MTSTPHSVALVFLLLTVLGVQSSEVSNPPIQFKNWTNLYLFGKAEAADFNGDGLPELVSEAGLRIYWNRGTNFVAGPSTNLNDSNDIPLPLATADFDNDSDIDLFFARRGRLSTNGLSLPWIYSTVLWNTGALGFTHRATTQITPMRRGDASAADFDNDGDLDLVICGSTNWTTVDVRARSTPLYENTGAGNFVSLALDIQPVMEGKLSWADFDSDGDMDLLVNGLTNYSGVGSLILYRNQNGSFVNSGLYLPRLLTASAAWGDYDNDGDLDLLLAGNRGTWINQTAFARIYRNDGATFSEVQIPTPTSPPGACWGDFDADGDLDVLLALPYTSRISLEENNGDGTFAAAQTLTNAGGQLVVADFDADGRLDIATHNLDWPVYVHRNVTEATNTPPEPPTDLFAAGTNGSVTFSWNASVDAQQTNGLTYNLRIGRTPGGSEVMSALANPTNGQRWIAGLGNTGLRTNWTIHKFGTGTYYWSVQAIDHCYAGSRFAQEQSFTVSNVPPVVEVEQIAYVTASSALLRIRLQSSDEPTIFFVEYSSAQHSGTAPSHELVPPFHLHSNLLLPALHPATTYQVRLVASNRFGVSYSSWRTFTTAAGAGVNELPTSFPALSQYPGFLPVDFDHDGDIDLIQSGNSNNVRQHWLFKNNTGLFTEGIPIVVPQSGASLLAVSAAADFNNDATVDLFFANNSQGYTFLRDGAGFRAGALIPRARRYQTFPGDAENDGDIDFLIPDASGLIVTTKISLNDHLDDFFRVSPSRLIPGQLGEWGDYDNDGDHDVLVFGLTNELQFNAQASTTIFRNNLGNSFTNAEANLPGTWRGATWLDHDNDGDLDLLILTGTNTSIAATNALKVYRNDGTNGMIEASTVAADVELTLLDPIDFNRDGLTDFFTYQDLTAADRLRLFLNLGEGQYTETNLGLPLLTNFQARFADMDGDRMPDIIVQAKATNFDQGRLRVFRNNLISTNPPPPVPLGLAAETGARHAILRWNLPSDALTNSLDRKYTLNLRVGTTPGGSEIMSAMSHPVTGARYLPQRGNAGQGGSWSMRDLPPGTYYWAVQSVDHSFNGSAFSEEASFTIEQEERTLRFLDITNPKYGTYSLMIDGPTRSKAQVLQSWDLVNWQTNGGYIYIPGAPAAFSPMHSESLFFRLQLLE